MSSAFDPTSFLNQTFNESNSTESVPVPEGEYPGIIEKVDVVPWSKTDGSASGLKLQVMWTIEDESVKELLGRSKVTQRQDIMLDLTESGDNLDFGKGRNIGLGRLREATDLNEPGAPFGFQMLPGKMAKVLVKHRAGQEPGQIFSEVKAVTHI
jgi:hypothetical protein